MLSVKGIWVRFEGLVAVQDISLDVRRGETHAVIGPNGAGKSTLFDVMGGQRVPTSGSVHLSGRDITALSPRRRAQLGIARTFQISALFPTLTAVEHVLLARTHLGRSASRGRWVPWWTRSDRVRAHELLESWGLSEVASERVTELSYGTQRQLEVILCMANGPEILLLDEPTSGLSMVEARHTVEQIASRKDDTAMLLVEHDMDVVADLADRITVMERGTILVTGDTQSVLGNEKVRAAYLGEAEDPLADGQGAAHVDN